MSWIDPLVQERFPFSVSKEVFSMLCGERLGSGIGREVYECTYDKSCVVKIEDRCRSFQNIHEWELWKEHKRVDTSLRKWLAPCVSISPSGTVLIQRRAKDVPFDLKLPKHVPGVLSSDMKHENWGIYKGHLVCRDYGRHEAISEASRGKNMVRADWLDTKGDHFRKPYFGRET